MLIAHFKLLSVSLLPAKDPYPASLLVALYDPDNNDTITLIAKEAIHARLDELEQFADVALKLSWRRIDLAALGGSGKGKAYRLQVVGLADEEPS
jgi:hypothetical protein